MLNQTSQYNRKTKDLLDSIETSGEVPKNQHVPKENGFI